MRIKNVTIFSSGMIMAFDDKGIQVGKCQGFLFEVIDKLKENCDENTEFTFGDWGNKTKIECTFNWWFKERRKKKEEKESKE